jgi:hypothetical protein
VGCSKQCSAGDAVGLVENIARGSTAGHVDVSVTLWTCVWGFASSNLVRDSDCPDRILEGLLGPCVLIRQADDSWFGPNIILQLIYLSFYYRLY